MANSDGMTTRRNAESGTEEKPQELSPTLRKALDAMAERSRNPNVENKVIASANGFLLVKPRP